MKPWKMGFTGAAVDDLVEFATSQLTPADKTICIPFAGSGKEIPAFASPDRTITSYDQQYLSNVVINGVFANLVPDTIRPMESYRMAKGYAYHNRMKDMPDEVAGIIDFLAKYGNLYDKAALAVAIIRGTFMGRLKMWGKEVTVEKTIRSYERRLQEHIEFTMQPGIQHTWGSILDQDLTGAEPYDVLYIDPPKVVGTEDIYSRGFKLLNEYLLQEPLEQPFTRWTKRNFAEQMRKVFEIPSKKIIFDYLSDTQPDLDDMLRVLKEYGTIEEVKGFDHGNRTDYCVVVSR